MKLIFGLVCENWTPQKKNAIRHNNIMSCSAGLKIDLTTIENSGDECNKRT